MYSNIAIHVFYLFWEWINFPPFLQERASLCDCLFTFLITKTRLYMYTVYNFDPLKPNFYIIHYFSFSLLKNTDCGYSLEPPRRGRSNEYPQSMF